MENQKNNGTSGRQWPINENININDSCTKISAIKNGTCQRCNSIVYAKLPSGKLYCRDCINIGRIVEGDFLIRDHTQITYDNKKQILTWKGKRTKAQDKVSQELINSFNSDKDHLVWAVTGAGKTEMLFPVIEQCLAKGKRVCIATPRIDVVNELYPRFKEAFRTTTIGLYHGRINNEVNDEQFVICTTHQLLKYYQAFDLMIIDEVDSFPYVNSKILHFGAKNAVKKSGITFYLSATPTQELLEQAKNKNINISKLKRRFHQGLLPVPKEQLFLRPFIKNKKLHPRLKKKINRAYLQGHPLLVFVPRISEISLYVQVIKQLNTELRVAGVHAQDKQRIDKVAEFRQGKIDVLVTTTILERGVTFKHVWVLIIAADDKIYTTANLVQIAGRVGRASDDKNGLVLFCYHRYTKQMRNAVRQIKGMNK